MLNFACPVKSVFIFNRGSSSRQAKIFTRHGYRRVNHPDEIGTGIHTLSILRIALKLHFVQNVEPNVPPQAGGKRGRFAKVSS